MGKGKGCRQEHDGKKRSEIGFSVCFIPFPERNFRKRRGKKAESVKKEDIREGKEESRKKRDAPWIKFRCSLC